MANVDPTVYSFPECPRSFWGFQRHTFGPWQVVRKYNIEGKDKRVVGFGYARQRICSKCGFTALNDQQVVVQSSL